MGHPILVGHPAATRRSNILQSFLVETGISASFERAGGVLFLFSRSNPVRPVRCGVNQRSHCCVQGLVLRNLSGGDCLSGEDKGRHPEFPQAGQAVSHYERKELQAQEV
jgi:hypothetical protein